MGLCSSANLVLLLHLLASGLPSINSRRIGQPILPSHAGIFGNSSSNVNKKKPFVQSQEAVQHCLDVAIVGAGLSGSYAAWKLRPRRLRISVFDKSLRVGGKCYTRKVNGLKFELGWMNYEPGKHRRFHKLVRDLRERTEDYVGDNDLPENRMYHLRGCYLYKNDTDNDSVPYNILQSSRTGGFFNLRRQIFQNNTQNPDAPDLLSLKTKDGINVFRQGTANIYHKYVNGEEVRYIKDTFGFHGHFTKNVNAALLFPARNDENPKLLTVRSGMNRIPWKMIEQFRRSYETHRYHLQHELIQIEKNTREKGFTLNFFRKNQPQKYHRVCAKKVILALPKEAIKKIRYRTLRSRKYQELLDSVHDIPVVKVFLAYKRPWWKDSPVKATDIRTDLPTHFTLDIGKPRTSRLHGLMAVFADKDIEYWETLQRSGNVFEKSLQGSEFSTEVLKHVNIHLAKVFRMKNDSIPQPFSGAWQHWNNEDTDTLWHLWKAKSRWSTIMRGVMKPYQNDELFVVGSAFSSGGLQMSPEGSLETVDTLINVFLRN